MAAQPHRNVPREFLTVTVTDFEEFIRSFFGVQNPLKTLDTLVRFSIVKTKLGALIKPNLTPVAVSNHRHHAQKRHPSCNNIATSHRLHTLVTMKIP